MVKGLPEATRVVCDDERVVANAGMLLLWTEAAACRLGILEPQNHAPPAGRADVQHLTGPRPQRLGHHLARGAQVRGRVRMSLTPSSRLTTRMSTAPHT